MDIHAGSNKSDIKAFLYIIAGCIMWAIITLLGAFSGQEKLDLLSLFWLANLVSLIISFVLFALRGITPIDILKANSGEPKNRSILVWNILRGVTLIHPIFLFAALQGENAIITIAIFELYPIFSVIFSVILLNKVILISKTTLVSLLTVILLGIFFTAFQKDQSVFSFTTFQLSDYGWTLLIAFGGMLLSGLSVGIAGRPIELLNTKSLLPPMSPVMQSLIVSAFSRLFCFILISIAIFMFGNWSLIIKTLLSIESFFIVLYLALFDSIATTVLAAVAGAVARSHTVHITWAMAPVFSIILLTCFGYGEITATIALGIVYILVPNLLLNIDSGKGSYQFTLLCVLIISTLVFLDVGRSIALYTIFTSDNYFSLLNTLLIFFVLLMAFIHTRLIKQQNREEKLLLSIIADLEKSHLKNFVKEQMTALILKLNNRKESKNAYFKLLRKKVDGLDCMKIHELFLSTMKGVQMGEKYVLIILSLLLVSISLFYRPNGFIYDTFALVICASIVFTLGSIYDTEKNRGRKILRNNNLQEFDSSNLIVQVGLETKKNQESLKSWIRGLSLIIIIFSIIGIFWLKAQNISLGTL